MRMNRSQLRQLLLGSDNFHPVPGVHDALSARILERAGGKFAILSGYSLSAVHFSQPDMGIISQTEVIDATRRICSSAPQLGLLVDGDTGYGGANNVRHLVTEIEKAGALGIMLEDQQWPKRCGHMDGKQIVPLEEHVKKIKAAIASREDSNFIVLARTDAKTVTGLDDAIARAKSYQFAGADMIFVEAMQSVDEMEQVRDNIDIPLMANMVAGGKTPILSSRELHQLGYTASFYPLVGLYAATSAMLTAYTGLFQLSDCQIDKTHADDIGFEKFNQLMGKDEFDKFEKQF